MGRTTTTKSNSPPTTTPSQYQPQDLHYQHFEGEMNVYHEILLGFCFKPSCLWDTFVPVYQAGVSIYHLAEPAIAIILPCLRKGANLHKIRALNFARILTIISVPTSNL